MEHERGRRGAQEEAASDLPLIAYRTRPSGMRLVPATSSRRWMDETSSRFAYHCLPLKMANQAGWFVLNDRPLKAVWDGSERKEAVGVEYLDAPEGGWPEGTDAPADLATGHFGHGILTFHIPFLFRTPPPPPGPDPPPSPVPTPAPVSARVTYNAETSTAVVNPNKRLGKKKTYTAVVEGANDADGRAVRDSSGTEMEQTHTWTFTTGRR